MAWDSTMRVIENKSDSEMADIILSRFCNGDTKDGTRYSLGGLYVRPYVTYVSKDALNAIEKVDASIVNNEKGVCYKKLSVKAMGITREHNIPISVLYEHFKEKHKTGKLTWRYILKWMPKLHIALITEREDKEITKAGYHKKMPKELHDPKSCDPLARYKASGLNDWVLDMWPVE